VIGNAAAHEAEPDGEPGRDMATGHEPPQVRRE
jgi:hypothetical protein